IPRFPLFLRIDRIPRRIPPHAPYAPSAAALLPSWAHHKPVADDEVRRYHMAVRSSSHLEDRLSVNGAPSTNRCRTTSGREHAGRITIRRMPDVAHPETRLSIRSERGFASGLAIVLVAVTWLFVPQMAS